MNTKMFFRVISIVLINSFLLLDAVWAGGDQIANHKNRDKLSAPIRITEQVFNASFNKLYEIKAPIIAVQKSSSRENSYSPRNLKIKLRKTVVPSTIHLLTGVKKTLKSKYFWAGLSGAAVFLNGGAAILGVAGFSSAMIIVVSVFAKMAIILSKSPLLQKTIVSGFILLFLSGNSMGFFQNGFISSIFNIEKAAAENKEDFRGTATEDINSALDAVHDERYYWKGGSDGPGFGPFKSSVNSLIKIGSPAIPAIIKEINKSSDNLEHLGGSTVVVFIYALGEIRDKTTLPFLHKILYKGEDPNVRAEIIRAMGKVGGEAEVKTLLELYKHPAIGLDRHYIYSFMQDAQGLIENSILMALGDIGSETTIEFLKTKFYEYISFKRYDCREKVEIIIDSLSKIGGAKAEKLLLEILNYEKGRFEEFNGRYDDVVYNHEKVMKELIMAFNKVDSVEGMFGALGWEKGPYEFLSKKGGKISEKLIDLAQDESESNSRRMLAIKMLGEFKETQAVGTLIHLLEALKDGSFVSLYKDEFREVIVSALVKMGDERAAPALVDQLGVWPEKDLDFLESAIAGFGNSAMKPLANALDDFDKRYRALKIIKTIGLEDSVVEYLLSELEKGNQKAALCLCRLIENPRVIMPLTSSLGQFGEEVDKWIIYALREARDKRVVLPLLSFYEKAGNVDLKVSIIDALADMGDLSVCGFLEKIRDSGPNAILRFFIEGTSMGYLYSPDSLKLQRAAKEAIEIIKQKNNSHSSNADKSIIGLFIGLFMPNSADAQGIGPEYYEYLRKAVEDKRRKEMSDLWIKALESADFQMREGAARMLINSEDPRAVFFGLLYESHKLGKDSNLEVIARLPKAEEYALEALNSRIYWIKTGAITVLEKVGTEKAVESLINLRKQTYEWVIRSKIIDALVNIGTKEVVQYLHGELKTMDKNENEIEYESLVFALGKIGDPGIVKELAKIYRSSDVGRNFMDRMFENIAAKSGFVTSVKIEVLKRPYVSAVLMLSLIGGLVIVIRAMIRKGGVEKGGKGLKNILLPVLLAPALITLISTLGWTADGSIQEAANWLGWFKEHWVISSVGIIITFWGIVKVFFKGFEIPFPDRWASRKLVKLNEKKTALEKEVADTTTSMTMDQAREQESYELSYYGTSYTYVAKIERNQSAVAELEEVNAKISMLKKQMFGAYLKALNSPNVSVRIWGAEGLGDIGDEVSIDPLTKALENATGDLLVVLLKALVKTRSVRAIVHIEKKLEQMREQLKKANDTLPLLLEKYESFTTPPDPYGEVSIILHSDLSGGVEPENKKEIEQWYSDKDAAYGKMLRCKEQRDRIINEINKCELCLGQIKEEIVQKQITIKSLQQHEDSVPDMLARSDADKKVPWRLSELQQQVADYASKISQQKEAVTRLEAQLKQKQSVAMQKKAEFDKENLAYQPLAQQLRTEIKEFQEDYEQAKSANRGGTALVLLAAINEKQALLDKATAKVNELKTAADKAESEVTELNATLSKAHQELNATQKLYDKAKAELDTLNAVVQTSSVLPTSRLDIRMPLSLVEMAI